MCFHHRLVFACGHYTWLSTIARPCAVETAFNKGETAIGCSKMWSSGFCTMKITKKCETCGEKEAQTARQAAEIRRRIGELRGLVEKITSSRAASSLSSRSASSFSSSSSSSRAEKKIVMMEEKEKEQLIEAGVVFDDEYEAQLEEFSPISSPVGAKFFSEP